MHFEVAWVYLSLRRFPIIYMAASNWFVIYHFLEWADPAHAEDKV